MERATDTGSGPGNRSTYPARIRPMMATDVTRLTEIDANFASPMFLDVLKETDGLNVSWRLVARPLDPPFRCTDFVFDKEEQGHIRRRRQQGDGLWLVAERADGRLVGMVDVQHQAWREAGWLWNIAVDREARGQGLGRALMEQVVAWGRQRQLRAIALETQTNNWPACRFYQRYGFLLTGLDDHFYTNDDVAQQEVALFWTYEL